MWGSPCGVVLTGCMGHGRAIYRRLCMCPCVYVSVCLCPCACMSVCMRTHRPAVDVEPIWSVQAMLCVQSLRYPRLSQAMNMGFTGYRCVVQDYGQAVRMECHGYPQAMDRDHRLSMCLCLCPQVISIVLNIVSLDLCTGYLSMWTPLTVLME